MCEHNLVFGKKYHLNGGNTKCGACGFETPDNFKEVLYVGDIEMENHHHFIFVIPFYCEGCGGKITRTNAPCRGVGPINVTQEFLSLPVRSRE